MLNCFIILLENRDTWQRVKFDSSCKGLPLSSLTHASELPMDENQHCSQHILAWDDLSCIGLINALLQLQSEDFVLIVRNDHAVG